MFSFGADIDESGRIPESLYTSKIFQDHSIIVVKGFESVVHAMYHHEEPTELERLARMLHGLGARHVTYGVHPAHYSMAGPAFLRTLETGCAALDESTHIEWTQELQQGWKATYNFIATAMMGGAGNELELTKIQRRDTERHKSATMRLHILRPSAGTSRLTRGKTLRRKPLSSRPSSSGIPQNIGGRDPQHASKQQQAPALPKAEPDTNPQLPQRRSATRRSSSSEAAESAGGQGGAHSNSGNGSRHHRMLFNQGVPNRVR
mmetsp:Transcript_7001/g.19014  ORF Transcript_7001/g.19014 Transcript_7001/m.19014 type:complete len:262 (-) Transcript_7001:186-971(-)